MTDLRRQRFTETVKVLSSPDFGGRLPGTEGGRLTSQYIAREFEKAGLVAAGEQGNYLQAVSLTTMNSAANIRYFTRAADQSTQTAQTLDAGQFVAWTQQRLEQQQFESELLFVGYGVHAPEFGWDDYAQLDVNGRLLVMLTGDPPVRSPDAPDRLDPDRFDGKAMTRHGRWDHKLALAAQRGATGVLLIHDAKAAGYRFSAVKNTFGRQRIYLSEPSVPPDEPPLSVWASALAFETMLEGTGLSLPSLKQAALQESGKAIELPLRLNAQLSTRWQAFESHNVIARIPATILASDEDGPMPRAPIVVMAHWDHLGPANGASDSAYFPGAADNASGIAQMLDVARRLTTVPDRARPIEFVALTAEESGLLGARHYVRSRLEGSTTDRPIAGINIDIANVFGRALDIEVIGLGLSTLDVSLREVARDLQRQVSPDYAPSIGRLFRSDQYELIRQGIPALWIRGGRHSRSFLMRGPITQIKRYLRSGYHQTGDTMQDWWDIDSALEDSNLISAFVARLSNESDRVTFNPGSPYHQQR